ncbi:flavohemo protein [Annulohypoxylon maeteangense]|uniref:flavohemo protein n=1 Tax=Annulohypoxylon maeteangense TaxID=1927788 RepID=UPI00200855BB|nr:flavohemo protein [Annulohypoxylon maeteangense]KAI0880190.1 flavohemo protein [Annulohypoxylon maeteangense]
MAVAAPISPEHIAIVKATAPVLKEHGTTITTLFYKNMIAANPELKNIFSMSNQESGAQPRALAAAVFAYATYVDDLGQLKALVERIAHKHESLNVQPDQYSIVGKYLLEAVAAVLGDACTPAIAEAWTAAYAALADVFINRERQLYSAHENWPGWRRFKIQRKVPETAEITSFYLVPEDEKPLPSFLPGQYISLQVFVPQMGHMQPRQYSLSEAPRSDYYRISVKREKDKQLGAPGLISNLLHDNYKEGDVLELSAPAGEFFVDPRESKGNPIALISAGVGLTPMISILNNSVNAGSRRRISWIHGVRNSEARAFKDHLRDVRAKDVDNNIKTTFFVTSPQQGEVQGVDYHFAGRTDLTKVDPNTALFLCEPGAEYYTCGPYSFMKDVEKYLVGAGVGPERIHLEVFGTGDQ